MFCTSIDAFHFVTAFEPPRGGISALYVNSSLETDLMVTREQQKTGDQNDEWAFAAALFSLLLHFIRQELGGK